MNLQQYVYITNKNLMYKEYIVRIEVGVYKTSDYQEDL